MIGVIFFGASCGYGFVGGKTDRPPGVQEVAIPVFGNRSTQAGIESDVTQALVEKFTSARVFSVTDEKSADALLTGTVSSFTTAPITVTTGTQTTTEYRATITIEFVFKRQKDGKVLRKEVISDWRNYPVVDNLNVTESNKKEAIRQISALLAERVHESILTNF
jgi:hypothetical protein